MNQNSEETQIIQSWSRTPGKQPSHNFYLNQNISESNSNPPANWPSIASTYDSNTRSTWSTSEFTSKSTWNDNNASQQLSQSNNMSFGFSTQWSQGAVNSTWTSNDFPSHLNGVIGDKIWPKNTPNGDIHVNSDNYKSIWSSSVNNASEIKESILPELSIMKTENMNASIFNQVNSLISWPIHKQNVNSITDSISVEETIVSYKETKEETMLNSIINRIGGWCNKTVDQSTPWNVEEIELETIESSDTVQDSSLAVNRVLSETTGANSLSNNNFWTNPIPNGANAWNNTANTVTNTPRSIIQSQSSDRSISSNWNNLNESSSDWCDINPNFTSNWSANSNTSQILRDSRTQSSIPYQAKSEVGSAMSSVPNNFPNQISTNHTSHFNSQVRQHSTPYQNTPFNSNQMMNSNSTQRSQIQLTTPIQSDQINDKASLYSVASNNPSSMPINCNGTGTVVGSNNDQLNNRFIQQQPLQRPILNTSIGSQNHHWTSNNHDNNAITSTNTTNNVLEKQLIDEIRQLDYKYNELINKINMARSISGSQLIVQDHTHTLFEVRQQLAAKHQTLQIIQNSNNNSSVSTAINNNSHSALLAGNNFKNNNSINMSKYANGLSTSNDETAAALLSSQMMQKMKLQQQQNCQQFSTQLIGGASAGIPSSNNNRSNEIWSEQNYKQMVNKNPNVKPVVDPNMLFSLPFVANDITINNNTKNADEISLSNNNITYPLSVQHQQQHRLHNQHHINNPQSNSMANTRSSNHFASSMMEFNQRIVLSGESEFKNKVPRPVTNKIAAGPISSQRNNQYAQQLNHNNGGSTSASISLDINNIPEFIPGQQWTGLSNNNNSHQLESSSAQRQFPPRY